MEHEDDKHRIVYSIWLWYSIQNSVWFVCVLLGISGVYIGIMYSIFIFCSMCSISHTVCVCVYVCIYQMIMNHIDKAGAAPLQRPVKVSV